MSINSEIKSTIPLRDTWLTTLSKKLDENPLIKDSLIQRISKVKIQFSTQPLPTLNENLVGWGVTQVFEASKTPPPYTVELLPCIAVLMRVFRDKEIQASFLSVSHVFLSSEIVTDALKKLQEKVAQGVIEVFITGGTSNTKKTYESILNKIGSFASEHPEMRYEIKDDTFGIVDIGTPYWVKDRMGYPASVGLSHVGFDENNNPYQVVDMKTEAYTGPLNEIEQIHWIKI